MSDLIDRQTAIDAIEEYGDRLQMVNWKENPGVPYKAYALNWCVNTIRDLPSVQPEVIRCKDCRYYDAYECKHPRALIFSEDDDFCSHAERRIDE